jgi:periplasmic divalent cation tolerance protein
MNQNEVLLVFTNMPDRASAERMANALVTEGVAACVNVMASCTSIYRWQSNIEQANEVPVLIKTTRAAYPRLEKMLRSLHAYEVPEIIALPVNIGLPEYLSWVVQETKVRN